MSEPDDHERIAHLLFIAHHRPHRMLPLHPSAEVMREVWAQALQRIFVASLSPEARTVHRRRCRQQRWELKKAMSRKSRTKMRAIRRQQAEALRDHGTLPVVSREDGLPL